jgi:hypothetical protein
MVAGRNPAIDRRDGSQANTIRPMSKDEVARFRQQAEECREQAAKAFSPLDKEAWLKVAEEWIKLAMAVEERRE